MILNVSVYISERKKYAQKKMLRKKCSEKICILNYTGEAKIIEMIILTYINVDRFLQDL